MADRLKSIAAVKTAVLAEMKRQAELHSLSSEDVLALAAFMTGSLIALQDQRTMTPGRAMALVTANIQAGNEETIATFLGQPKGRA